MPGRRGSENVAALYGRAVPLAAERTRTGGCDDLTSLSLDPEAKLALEKACRDDGALDWLRLAAAVAARQPGGEAKLASLGGLQASFAWAPCSRSLESAAPAAGAPTSGRRLQGPPLSGAFARRRLRG